MDAQLSFSPVTYQNLRVSLWGRNLSNELYIQGTLLTTFADGVTYSAPRTFGVRAEFEF